MENFPFVKEIESKFLAEEMRMKLEDGGISKMGINDKAMMTSTRPWPFRHLVDWRGYNHVFLAAPEEHHQMYTTHGAPPIPFPKHIFALNLEQTRRYLQHLQQEGSLEPRVPH